LTRSFSYGIGTPSAVTYTVANLPVALRNKPIDHRGDLAVLADFFVGV
jgi:hypothetical protein